MRIMKQITALKIEIYSLVKKHLFRRRLSTRQNKFLCYIRLKLRHAQELFDFISDRIDFAGRMI